jgi:phage baseplate assembly protein W
MANTKGISLYFEDGLTLSQEIDNIKESITRILMTSPGERVNNPKFGSRFKEFIFENELTIDGELQSEVYNCISRWEPRVTVTDVKVVKKPEEHAAYITVIFRMKETGQPASVEFSFIQ